MSLFCGRSTPPDDDDKERCCAHTLTLIMHKDKTRSPMPCSPPFTGRKVVSEVASTPQILSVDTLSPCLLESSASVRKDKTRSSAFCEGGGDVVGVLTPVVRGVTQDLNGDQVLELRVQLEVQKVEGNEEDRNGQVEVEREKRLKEVHSWMTVDDK